MGKINDSLNKIKLWQEECKLVVMFIGAVSAVALFVTNLMSGKVVAVKAMEKLGGTGAAPVESIQFPWKISMALIVVALVIGFVYCLIVVIKKHRKQRVGSPLM